MQALRCSSSRAVCIVVNEPQSIAPLLVFSWSGQPFHKTVFNFFNFLSAIVADPSLFFHISFVPVNLRPRIRLSRVIRLSSVKPIDRHFPRSVRMAIIQNTLRGGQEGVQAPSSRNPSDPPATRRPVQKRRRLFSSPL